MRTGRATLDDNHQYPLNSESTGCYPPLQDELSGALDLGRALSIRIKISRRTLGRLAGHTCWAFTLRRIPLGLPFTRLLKQEDDLVEGARVAGSAHTATGR